MMVNLRRGFLRTEGKKENLEELLSGSLSTVLAACRGIMWLAEKNPADNIDDLLAAVRTAYNADTAAIDRVWHLRKGRSESTATLETLFESYVDEIARLASIVDKL
jgi:alpha-D-ribose 1-methylphosphonate 5-triphosphate diphosphatase PhnM